MAKVNLDHGYRQATEGKFSSERLLVSLSRDKALAKGRYPSDFPALTLRALSHLRHARPDDAEPRAVALAVLILDISRACPAYPRVARCRDCDPSAPRHLRQAFAPFHSALFRFIFIFVSVFVLFRLCSCLCLCFIFVSVFDTLQLMTGVEVLARKPFKTCTHSHCSTGSHIKHPLPCIPFHFVSPGLAPFSRHASFRFIGPVPFSWLVTNANYELRFASCTPQNAN